MHLQILSTDFEIGHFLRARIIPKAVLYYTGDIVDEDDDDEFDEEEEEVRIRTHFKEESFRNDVPQEFYILMAFFLFFPLLLREKLGRRWRR